MKTCEICGKEITGLGFSCKFCTKEFCSEHRLPENHDCVGLMVYKQQVRPGNLGRYSGNVNTQGNRKLYGNADGLVKNRRGKRRKKLRRSNFASMSTKKKLWILVTLLLISNVTFIILYSSSRSGDGKWNYPGSFYVLGQFDANYNTNTIILKNEISYEDYFYYRTNQPHSYPPVSEFDQFTQILGFCRPDSVKNLAEFIKTYVDFPSDDECVIDALLTYVQDRGAFQSSLHYVSDGEGDFAKYPLETLCEGGGDCEDLSILFASLVRALNYDVRLVFIPGHVFVAIKLDTPPSYGGSYAIEVDGNYYYCCETTAYGWLIGDLPPDFVGIQAQSLPLI